MSTGGIQYLPEIKWKTNVENVVFISPDQYELTAIPIDVNDPGAPTREIGNYLKDYAGHVYTIISSTSTTITVEDEFDMGVGPQQGREGVVYSSVDGGKSPFLAPVYLDRLDKSARDFTNSFEKDILWKHIETIPANTVKYDITYTPAVEEEEGTTYWNPVDNTLNVVTGVNGTILQVGQEFVYKVYNNTGVTLENGKVIHPTGLLTPSGVVHVELAQADRWENCFGRLGFITGSIPHGEEGFATTQGLIRDIDTSAVTTGFIFLDAVVAGNYVNTPPTFPNFVLNIGGVGISDPTNGTIIAASVGSISDTFQNFWNGTIRESFHFDVVDDGAGGLKGQLLPADGHPNLTALFSDGLYTIIATPPAEVALIPGTNTVPQMNYVYVLGSTKALTVSTSGFPSSVEHIKIGSYYLQSASLTLGNGPLKSHPWNDHIISNHNYQGHLSHITQRLRQEGAQWSSELVVLYINYTNNHFQLLILKQEITSTYGMIIQILLEKFLMYMI
jgi:hypothetical protein